jgi:hypothetical protein
MYSADDDNFNKMYYNQVKTSNPAGVPVNWDGHTKKTELKHKVDNYTSLRVSSILFRRAIVV